MTLQVEHILFDQDLAKVITYVEDQLKSGDKTDLQRGRLEWIHKILTNSLETAYSLQMDLMGQDVAMRMLQIENTALKGIVDRCQSGLKDFSLLQEYISNTQKSNNG